MMEVPEDPSWTNLATSADVRTSPSRETPTGPAGQFLPDRLVDRDSTKPWQARRSGDADFTLKWDQPIQAREVVIYAPASSDGDDQVITAFTLTRELSGTARGEVELVNRTLEPSGTRVALEESVPFDTLTVSIAAENVTGTHEGHEGTAVSEIEVIARSADRRAAGFIGHFIRGDANCDQDVGMSDVFVIMQALFGGRQTICCEAAADVNDDESINMTDGIYQLNFLFLGGRRPAAPFPGCGAAFGTGALGCAVSACE